MKKTLIASALVLLGATAARAEDPFLGMGDARPFVGNGSEVEQNRAGNGGVSYGFGKEGGNSLSNSRSGTEQAETHSDYVRENVRPDWSGS